MHMSLCVCALQCVVDGVAESEVGHDVKYHLQATATPTTLEGTMCTRWQGPDKTHAHMHTAWTPLVLGSDQLNQAGPVSFFLSFLGFEDPT